MQKSGRTLLEDKKFDPLIAELVDTYGADDAAATWVDAERRLDEFLCTTGTLSKLERMHAEEAIYPMCAAFLAVANRIGRDEATQMFATFMRRHSEETGEQLGELLKRPALRRVFLRGFGMVGAKVFGPEAGFEQELHEVSGTHLSMDILDCPYVKHCRLAGAPELAPLFCANDDYAYGNLPGIAFARKGTLARGDARCDFDLRLVPDGEDEAATDRHAAIRSAYANLGSSAPIYDQMMTCSTPLGTLMSQGVWLIGAEENEAYLRAAMAGVPEDFCGSLLEVPVGTGVLTMPLYQTLPEATITCLDYSPDMMSAAKRRAEESDLRNVTFVQGDVGSLPFEDESFDVVLSLNGFHAFPDKDAAFAETLRVLKPGGTFCGCFYVQGEVGLTDWWIRNFHERRGFFTPPYETPGSLEERLRTMYSQVHVEAHKAIACFTCVK